MTRFHVTYDFSKGPDAEPVTTPFSPEEEAAADLAEQQAATDPAPTLDDLAAQVSALTDALVAKQVISQADVDAKATEISIAQPMRIE